MESARIVADVTAGVIPGQVESEYTRRYVLTSQQWYATDHDLAKRVELLGDFNKRITDYAMTLMARPDRVNWVHTEWVYL